MTGFLFDLLRRTRGTADVMRPRVAALFEPLDSVGPVGVWPGEVQETERSIAGSAAPGAGIRGPEHHGEGAPGRRVRGSQRVLDGSDTERPLSERGGEANARDAAGVAHIRSAVSTAELKLTATSANDLPAADSDTGKPSGGLPDGRTGAAASIAGQSTIVAPDSAAQLSSERSRLEPSLAAYQTLPSLTSSTRRPRFEAARVEPQPTEPQANVHVTIGRIEVRAIAEPSPQRQARSESPVMTLKEYLETRARGGRR